MVDLGRTIKKKKKILLVLEEIKKGQDKCAAKASAMSTLVKVIRSTLVFLIFSSAEQLSTNLQAKAKTIQEAILDTMLCVTYIWINSELRQNLTTFKYFCDKSSFELQFTDRRTKASITKKNPKAIGSRSSSSSTPNT